VDVVQAYGNCPQYIRRRHINHQNAAAATDFPIRRGVDVATDDIELIRSADTFFLGTTHLERGNDASHRGGRADFVYADHETVEWPDYPGNNMFNSFGNLAVDPTTALLFIDFRSGRTLQLSGSARVAWTSRPPTAHRRHEQPRRSREVRPTRPGCGRGMGAGRRAGDTGAMAASVTCSHSHTHPSRPRRLAGKGPRNQRRAMTSLATHFSCGAAARPARCAGAVGEAAAAAMGESLARTPNSPDGHQLHPRAGTAWRGPAHHVVGDHGPPR
jgi:hypothetical protein